VLGDITDGDNVARVFQRHQPDIVFHAAAYKHVPMLEAHPDQAVYVNVHGTLNLCSAAAEQGCERFVFISTDKAVHPVNVLGFSKRIGELVVRAHNNERSVFCSVRFGNVVGSRGSALPEFIRQIDAGGPVTVTHPDVERYFMTIPEAVSLVIQAGAFATGGELFMLDMGQPIKIAALVQRIIRLRGLRIGKDIEIVYTGLRPGEKLTEDLMFEGEHAAPTLNPTILAVADETPAERQELEQEIGLLLQIAGRADHGAVRRVLADIASGRVGAHGWLDTAG
jgi:FlaA1/EpsC-like NDP-sugar epimerase